MTTFKMPGLSRYRFTHEGEVIIEKTGYYRSKYNDKQYSLTADNGILYSVSIVEIIQYGKHVKEYAPIALGFSMGLGYDFVTKKMKPCSVDFPKFYNQELIRHKKMAENTL